MKLVKPREANMLEFRQFSPAGSSNKFARKERKQILSSMHNMGKSVRGLPQGGGDRGIEKKIKLTILFHITCG